MCAASKEHLNWMKVPSKCLVKAAKCKHEGEGRGRDGKMANFMPDKQCKTIY